MKTKNENFDSFEARLIAYNMPEEDIQRVMFAYQISKEGHRRYFRDGGKTRYFEHPRQGCLVLMDELGIYSARFLVAFLLHDTGEDTPVLGNIKENYEKWVKIAKFRADLIYPGAGELVVRLTKPFVDGVCFHTKEEAFNHYLNNLSPGEVTLLKAVDRLVNLRDMDSCKPAKVKKQIIETREVYAPIFNTLLDSKASYEYGVYLIKHITGRLEELDNIQTD